MRLASTPENLRLADQDCWGKCAADDIIEAVGRDQVKAVVDLVVEEVGSAPLQAGQVRLKVAACGVNFPDVLITQGKYQFKPELPFTLGMEVAGRVGRSLGGLRATKGGYPLPVWGISSNQLGATAAAAHVLGLDAGKMLHALGLAAFHAPVPSHVKYNYTKEVGYAKFAPSGWMAQGGVTTATLAQMGYRGDTSFLETERGFWAMNAAPAWDEASVLDGIGSDWVFLNAAYKFWPTCGFYQSPLDALTALIEAGGDVNAR